MKTVKRRQKRGGEKEGRETQREGKGRAVLGGKDARERAGKEGRREKDKRKGRREGEKEVERGEEQRRGSNSQWRFVLCVCHTSRNRITSPFYKCLCKHSSVYPCTPRT